MSSISSSFDSLLLSECSDEIVAGTMSDVSEVMAVVAVRSIAGVLCSSSAVSVQSVLNRATAEMVRPLLCCYHRTSFLTNPQY